MTLLKTLIGIALIISTPALADTIYTCTEDVSAIIGWEESGIFKKKKGLEAEATSPPKEPLSISLVVKAKSATLKGNMRQSELVKIGEDTFIEGTGVGNRIMWTLLEGHDDVPTYLFCQKAYSMVHPFAITVAYRCK